jgi:hypothetical protein
MKKYSLSKEDKAVLLEQRLETVDVERVLKAINKGL